MIASSIVVAALACQAQAWCPATERAREIGRAAGVEVRLSRMPGSLMAVYDPAYGTVFVNDSPAAWAADLAALADPARPVPFSSRHPDHVIRHEIGHARLHRLLGHAGWVRVYSSPLPLPASRIRERVGRYAASGPLEFTAEVYAGVWSGVRYPADVMLAYHRLWLAGLMARLEQGGYRP